MIVRRIPMLVGDDRRVIAVALGAGTAVVPTDAVFSTVSAPWMPAAPLPGGLTSSWFCPGVPAAGEEGRTGSITVFNSADVALRGRLTVLRVDGEPVTQDIEVPPFRLVGRSPRRTRRVPVRGRVRRDRRRRRARRAARRRPGGRVGRGLRQHQRRGVVPRRRRHARRQRRNARAVEPPRLSGGRRHHPGNRAWGPDSRDVSGVRRPRSVRAGDRRGNRSSAIRRGSVVSVVATRGRVVVGRSQLLGTAERTGYVMTLAAPAARDQWWFVYGERADNVVENYYLYNPGEEDADRDTGAPRVPAAGWNGSAGVHRRSRRRGGRVPRG